MQKHNVTNVVEFVEGLIKRGEATIGKKIDHDTLTIVSLADPNSGREIVMVWHYTAMPEIMR